MPVQRFNDHGLHPNPHISFISPIKTQSSENRERALGVLRRVAAIVTPLMKSHGLAVTALDEFPFNDSFAGRNWNAGESVELVLRTRNGGWVNERFVLAVMLHELAHIKHMNHAAPFWQTLKGFKAEVEVLVQSGYTGDGFYAKGHHLGTGAAILPTSDAGDLPRQICGGTFRRGRRGRRVRVPAAGRKGKERRLDGEKLGGDSETRRMLDGGIRAPPRVARSKRGAELRASAAELRFGVQLGDAYNNNNDMSDDEQLPEHRFEDEDETIKGKMQHEMDEFLSPSPLSCGVKGEGETSLPEAAQEKEANVSIELAEICGTECGGDGGGVISTLAVCPVCTAEVALDGTICGTCAHVHDACAFSEEQVWRCGTETCLTARYVNHVDVGVCGACGLRRTKRPDQGHRI